MPHAPYPQTYRRALLDMHISESDPGFMTRFDASALADAYKAANLTGAMIYCKSHTGLTNWPAPVGRMHPGLHGRDIVGDLVRELHERDISVCAYHSATFDNVAWLDNPEWRVVSPGKTTTYFEGRVAGTCMNNPDYREYEVAQIAHLASNYDFDAFFTDIAMFTGICVCDQCQRRYRVEESSDIPSIYDWTSPSWVRFERARQRWSSEFCDLIRETVREARPDLPYYSNATLTMFGALSGRDFDSLRGDSFVGGDRYGSREDQMLATKVFSAVVPSSAPEFITGRVPEFGQHVDLKGDAELTLRALAAIALNSALLFTDCVNPDGTVHRPVYEAIGRAYELSAAFEPFLGGTHIEQVGVYFSEHSLADITQPPMPIAEAFNGRERWPHAAAWLGACRALQRSHIPFGAVTRFQLDDLDRYDVLVLPNLQLLGADEIAAIRSFVARGGSLYASGYTSLVTSDGVRHQDFELADVFGVHFAADEAGKNVYVKPQDPDVARAVHPQDFLSHNVQSLPPFSIHELVVGYPAPRLATDTSATILATLSLPFAYPAHGTLEDGLWASMHNNPPWHDTDHPSIVENRYENGRAIFSAAPIETKAGANERTFISLIERLLNGPIQVSARTHPAVWVEAFDQEDRQRVVVSVVNYQEDGPPIPVPVEITVAFPGKTVTSVTRAIGAEQLPWQDSTGQATFSAGPVEWADMFVVQYEPAVDADRQH